MFLKLLIILLNILIIFSLSYRYLINNLVVQLHIKYKLERVVMIDNDGYAKYYKTEDEIAQEQEDITSKFNKAYGVDFAPNQIAGVMAKEISEANRDSLPQAIHSSRKSIQDFITVKELENLTQKQATIDGTRNKMFNNWDHLEYAKNAMNQVGYHPKFQAQILEGIKLGKSRDEMRKELGSLIDSLDGEVYSNSNKNLKGYDALLNDFKGFTRESTTNVANNNLSIMEQWKHDNPNKKSWEEDGTFYGTNSISIDNDENSMEKLASKNINKPNSYGTAAMMSLTNEQTSKILSLFGAKGYAFLSALRSAEETDDINDAITKYNDVAAVLGSNDGEAFKQTVLEHAEKIKEFAKANPNRANINKGNFLTYTITSGTDKDGNPTKPKTYDTGMFIPDIDFSESEKIGKKIEELKAKLPKNKEYSENEVNPATDIFAKAIEAAQENYRNSLSTENTPDTLIAAIQEALRQEELRRASTQYGVALERNPLTGELWIPYGKRNS